MRLTCTTFCWKHLIATLHVELFHAFENGLFHFALTYLLSGVDSLLELEATTFKQEMYLN